MAKKVEAYIKLQVPAGQANPSPPVGPALGQHGVNIMEFCKAFNAATGNLEQGMPVPVVITVYNDRSFTYITKTPPASILLKKAAGIKAVAGHRIQIKLAKSLVNSWKKSPRLKSQTSQRLIWMLQYVLLLAVHAAWGWKRKV